VALPCLFGAHACRGLLRQMDLAIDRASRHLRLQQMQRHEREA
jgi:hypothetical protein